MKNIKVIDMNGKEVTGNWNEKIYNSKYNGFVRIYLDNKEVNVEKSQLDDDIVKISEIIKIDYLTKDFSTEQIVELIDILLNRENVLYGLLEKQGITKKRYKNKAIESINNILIEVKQEQNK